MRLALVPEFDWFRCPDGYRLISPKKLFEFHAKKKFEAGSHPILSALWGGSEETMIVPNSGRTELHKIREGEDLYLVFSHLKTADDLLAFITRHGPLMRIPIASPAGIPNIGDDLTQAFAEVRFFRSALQMKNIQDLYITPDMQYTMEAFDGTLQSVGDIVLHFDPSRGISLRLKPRSLREFLFWQLARQLLGGTKIRSCKHCGVMFEAGRGTGRRGDAIFCCREHKVRFLSLARSQNSSP